MKRLQTLHFIILLLYNPQTLPDPSPSAKPRTLLCPLCKPHGSNYIRVLTSQTHKRGHSLTHIGRAIPSDRHCEKGWEPARAIRSSCRLSRKKERLSSGLSRAFFRVCFVKKFLVTLVSEPTACL